MDDVLAIAERGIELLAEGLVGVSSATGVVVVALHEGRAGRADGPPEALDRLVKAATLRARQARAWPVGHLPPAHAGESRTGADVTEAVATTWGTRTVESRKTEGTGPFVLPVAWERPKPPISAAPAKTKGTGPFVLAGVLGPTAVVDLLVALRPAFGVELALGAEPPVAGPAVTLVDDASGQRAFDVEGVPRQRVVLIERGVFVGGVRDGSSPPSTGHASRPLTLAPVPEHLALEPGEAELGPPDAERLGPLRTAEAVALLARIEAVGPDGAVWVR